MVLGRFFPDIEFTWEALDELSGKRPGKWTWPLRGIGEIADRGLLVEVIDDFDYHQFVSRAENYLLERFGAEAGSEQIANSDVPYEVEVAAKYSHIVSRTGIPTIEDLQSFISRGMLPVACLNLPALYGKPGYLGHFVLVRSVTSDAVSFDDPGISTAEFPGRKGSTVNIEVFRHAWAIDRFVFAVGAA